MVVISEYSTVLSKIFMLKYFNILSNEAEYLDITVPYRDITTGYWISIFLHVQWKFITKKYCNFTINAGAASRRFTTLILYCISEKLLYKYCDFTLQYLDCKLKLHFGNKVFLKCCKVRKFLRLLEADKNRFLR